MLGVKQQRERRASGTGLRPRNAFVGVLAWGLFLVGWALVARWRVFVDPLVLLALLLVAAGTIAVTRLWVWHNKQIYRRKGPRRAVAAVEFRYDHDRLGRMVSCDRQVLATAREVEIDVDAQGRKVYSDVTR